MRNLLFTLFNENLHTWPTKTELPTSTSAGWPNSKRFSQDLPLCKSVHAATFSKGLPHLSGPEYQGLNIHQEDDYPMNDNYGVYTYDEEISNTEPIAVLLGSFTSNKGAANSRNALYALNSHPDKIYAKVMINENHNISLKVDTGADACIITTTDLQHFLFPLSILPWSNVLRGYGGSEIENVGAPILKVSLKGK